MLNAQVIPETNEPADTSKPEKVIVKHSDLGQGTLQDDKEIRYLKGNVELRQGNTFMSCDTAILFVADNNVIAYGNVLIQQGDSSGRNAKLMQQLRCRLESKFAVVAKSPYKLLV